jgi:hypothetical protein
MAQAPHPAGDGGADFVRRIVTDPKNVPDVMLLYGYLGASSEEGHERLYLNPDLSNFVEVPKTAILHQAQATKEQDPNAGVTLWVKKDAKLIYKMAPAQQAAQQALAYYFAGAIQAGAGAATPPIPQQTLPQALCPAPTIIEAACPATQAGPCPTRIATCHVTCAPNCTHVAPCPAFYQTCVGLGTCAPACQTHPPEATCGPSATCAVTCHATCVPVCTHVASCVATCLASCAPNCTHVAPCPTFVATCAATCQATCAPGCPTHHLTCAPVCTHVTPCVTRGQPDCPFPSEIPAQCTHIPNCPHPQAAGMAGGAGTPVYTGPACGPSVVIECTPACLTRYVSCNASCAPECWISRYEWCGLSNVVSCHFTCHPKQCIITQPGYGCP